jgi:hypothetical protein
MIKNNEINSQCVIFLYRQPTCNLAENPATNIVQLVRENSQNIENPRSTSICILPSSLLSAAGNSL